VRLDNNCPGIFCQGKGRHVGLGMNEKLSRFRSKMRRKSYPRRQIGQARGRFPEPDFEMFGNAKRNKDRVAGGQRRKERYGDDRAAFFFLERKNLFLWEKNGGVLF